MKKGIALFIFFTFFILTLTSCTFHITELVTNKLDPTVLYEAYQTKPIDLNAISKCALPPSVSLISTEKRDENYLIWDKGGDWYVNPRELTRHIIDYMRDAFDKCKVKVDDNSTKVIQVSLKEAKLKHSSWGNYGADIQLKIDIPERQYSKIFEAEDWTPKGPEFALSYAIHVTSWKIIADTFVQDYVLCRE